MCSRSKEPVLYTMEGVEEDEEDETALPDSTFFVRDAEGDCVWTTYEYSMVCGEDMHAENQQFRIIEI